MKHNLLTLKLFLTVAKVKSIAQASEIENISASAVSKRISDLEYQVGTPLFYRQTRGVELTPAGLELMRHSSNILRLIDRMDAHMGDFASGLRGTVRIAANTSAITQFLPEDLAGFVEDYPDIKINLSELTSDEILTTVRDGLSDVGIFSGLVPEPDDLDVFPYRRDTLVLVIAGIIHWRGRAPCPWLRSHTTIWSAYRAVALCRLFWKNALPKTTGR